MNLTSNWLFIHPWIDWKWLLWYFLPPIHTCLTIWPSTWKARCHQKRKFFSVRFWTQKNFISPAKLNLSAGRFKVATTSVSVEWQLIYIHQPTTPHPCSVLFQLLTCDHPIPRSGAPPGLEPTSQHLGAFECNRSRISNSWVLCLKPDYLPRKTTCPVSVPFDQMEINSDISRLANSGEG